MNVRSRLLLSALMLTAAASPVFGQFGPSPRAAGVSGAFSALAVGYEAVDWNPANLALPGNPSWSLALPRFDAVGAILGPNLFDIHDIFDKGQNLTDADRHAFLDKVADTGFEVRSDVRVPWVALSIGPFAVSASSTLHMGGSVGKELIDLMLYARQYGDLDQDRLTEYRVGNTAIRDAAYTTIAASYGHNLGSLLPLPFPVTVGVTGRYVIGHDLQRARLYEPRVELEENELYISALSLRSTAGTGYGFDIGFAARPIPALTVGLTFENIAQKMTWDEELELRGDEFEGSEFADLGAQDIYDRLQPRPFDPTSAPLEAYSLLADLFTQTYFPRVIRFGAGIDLGLTKLGATYKTTQGKGEFMSGWPSYIAVGVEQTLPLLTFITLRAGLANSLDGASAVSGGATLQLGPLGMSAALSRTTGNGQGPDGLDFDTRRYAERMAAASGYAFSIGATLRGF